MAGCIFCIARDTKYVMLAIFLVFLWCLYEVVEFARIKDDCDIDLANGIGAFVLSILCCQYQKFQWQKLIQLIGSKPFKRKFFGTVVDLCQTNLGWANSKLKELDSKPGFQQDDDENV